MLLLQVIARLAKILRFVLQDEVGSAQDVFLYCKSHLRSAGEAPEPESLEPIHVDGGYLSSLLYCHNAARLCNRASVLHPCSESA